MASSVTATPGLPVTANLTAYHGDSWTQQFRLMRGDQPLDLTGYSAAAQCRSNTGELYPMSATIDADPTSGQLTLGFAVDAMPEAADYAYDVELLEPGGGVTTWVRGRLKIQRDVTNELAGARA